MIWEPDNAMPLIEELESVTNISASISVTSDMGDVSLSYTLEDPLNLFDITLEGSSINIFAEHLVGFFPIIHIQYLNNREYGEVYDWEDLPEEAEDIISFRRDKSAVRTLLLTVDAEDTVGMLNESKVYEIVIRADYTGSRNKLVSEVDKRR